ncbi:MAG TPA: MBL fold metallo-hydrolase [Candidatus Acidoferrales bacterium]|nr:MBL fold metallo-hydrolase [Candidatus Acidoferrales bacterium]
MTPAIFPIRLRISTAYVILGARAVLVDTGSEGEEERILRGLRRYNVEPERVALLLHTHGHTDHAGSTRALKERLRIPAAVHPADAGKMRAGDSGALVPLRFSSRVVALFINPRFPAVEPDLLIEEGYSLVEFGIPAAVVHTPGHTPGSISILFDDGRAIAGDLMMGGSLGGAYHATEPGYHYFAEDLTELRRSIRKLLDRGARTIYLGHGGPLDAGRARERFSPDFAGI